MSEAIVLSEHVCELGEGPTYDPDTATLFWFDINGRKLLSRRDADGVTQVVDLPEMASALAVIDERRHMILTETGIHVRDLATGRLSLHTAVEADNPLTRSNDARVHASGALWFGTMAKTEATGAGAIYWFRKGELRRLYGGISIPNSICFSPDGAIAYFTDTRRNALMRVACDPATGLPVGEPAILIDHDGVAGWIDGSVCDAEGVIWNARWGSGRVDAYAPDGRQLASHAVPAVQSSCPAFCGPGLSQLAVTSAWKGMSDAARAADPHGGKTFLLDIGVKGRPEPRVAL